jgi:hypothetical protein
VSPLLKQLLRATLLLALAAAAAAAPSTAPAAGPCWKQLLNDWYDGHIDKTYNAGCYREALKHLPTDVEVYSSARSDIQRALAAAVATAKQQHKRVKDISIAPAGGSGGSGGGTTTTTAVSGGGGSTGEGATTTTAGGGGGGAATTDGGTATEPVSTDGTGRQSNDNGPVGSALDKAGHDADSVPLPLIILGVLALLLIAGGAAGMLVRRSQARGPAT